MGLDVDRREFLRAGGTTAAAAIALNALPPGIRGALAAASEPPPGSIADVAHVVILMQENRSFDHYFGAMNGVRGFADPRPMPLPSGKNVWHQANSNDATRFVLPFPLNVAGTSASFAGLDHGWKGTQSAWANWDAWIDRKTARSMGYFDGEDLPLYYALANAYTICDAYHCSLFGQTDINRAFLFSGKCTGTAVFPATPLYTAIVAPLVPDPGGSDIRGDDNSKIDSLPNWKTYAETLQAAGVSWRVYQEMDNFADNGFQYFRNFRVDSTNKPLSGFDNPHLGPAENATNRALYNNGRAFIESPDLWQAVNSNGDALISQFKQDVLDDTLPQVSWICAPSKASEHPTNSSPEEGQIFVAKLMNALKSNSRIAASTVFFINYDENDGFFDHMPPPIPPLDLQAHGAEVAGKSVGIVYGKDEEIWYPVNGTAPQPMGLGPRVPMLVVSPWSKGGKVCSELFDHTSVLRFMEVWLTAKGYTAADVCCPNISAWRRAICGDLTSAFDFKTKPSPIDGMFVPPPAPRRDVYGRPFPEAPQDAVFPDYDSSQRRACALKYGFVLNAIFIQGERLPRFESVNPKDALGVALIAYANPLDRDQKPFHYAIASGQSLSWHEETVRKMTIGTQEGYSWSFFGPNGFLAEFSGEIPANVGERGIYNVDFKFDAATRVISLVMDNHGNQATRFEITSRYLSTLQNGARCELAGGEKRCLKTIDVSSAQGWYDITVAVPFLHSAADGSVGRYIWRYAGHLENGRDSVTYPVAVANSDPAKTPAENEAAQKAGGPTVAGHSRVAAKKKSNPSDLAILAGALTGFFPAVTDVFRTLSVLTLPASLLAIKLLAGKALSIPEVVRGAGQSIKALFPAVAETVAAAAAGGLSAVKAVTKVATHAVTNALKWIFHW